MADFEHLDPQTRCFALVGQYLQAYSVMEGALHEAIGAALAVEPIKVTILTANLRFQDKTHILRTLVDVANAPEDQKARVQSRLRKLSRLAGKRNMIAHDPFHPDETKTGVEFLTVKAKGEFSTPNVVWSPHRFEQEGKLLDGFRRFLREIELCFAKQPPRLNYASALLRFLEPPTDTWWWASGQTPMPMRNTASSSPSNPPSQPNQAHPDSDPASHKTSVQKPDNPEG